MEYEVEIEVEITLWFVWSIIKAFFQRRDIRIKHTFDQNPFVKEGEGDVVDVYFFENGNTIVFQDEEQVPELQHSWRTLFTYMLASSGVDVLRSSFTMPDGRPVRPFLTDEGTLNWENVKEEVAS